MIDITLLGTAALLPLPERALTAAVLTCAGRSILFDCGEGTQTAARKAHVSLMKTDIIALTHYHGDHIFGLPGLLQTMFSMGRTDPLYITGPARLKDTILPLLILAGQVSYEIYLIEVEKHDVISLNTLLPAWSTEAQLTIFPTQHRVPSQGYCFTLSRAGKFQAQNAKELGVPVKQWKLLQQGKSVQVGDRTVEPSQVMGKPRKGLKFVFSGDTTSCPTLQEAAYDADLLISDATYGEDEQGQMAAEYGHMNFMQAATLAANARVKQLWLAHYSQMIKDPQVYLPNATKIFKNTVCGEDGMRITLRFAD